MATIIGKSTDAYYSCHIRSGVELSNYAFMAMKFGDDILDTIYNSVFVPAVAKTGFTLRKLDDSPEAGLIDNLLRQKIKQSRFVIADLSHLHTGHM